MVDVRADHRVGEHDAEAFEVTASVCEQVGWSFARVDEPDPVFAANLRWLAGYRHPRNLNPRVARPVLEAFSEPLPVMEGVMRVGEPIKVLPTLFHLLWRQFLITDLEASVLSQRSIVGAGRRAS